VNFMPKRKVTDTEIKADIMNKLLRKNCWGAKYLPIEALVSWIAKRIKKNGKRIRRNIKELVNNGYLLIHKGGRTISLNPTMSKEILEYIEKIIERD